MPPLEATRVVLRRLLGRRRVVRVMFRGLAVLVALVAALQGTARAFTAWRCISMQQRLFEPCCPGESGDELEDGAAHDEDTARLSPRCCEQLDAPDFERLRSNERGASRLLTPIDFAAISLPPPLVAANSALAPPPQYRATPPPGKRLRQLSAILRI